jgi:hypothetical protein
MNCWSVDVALRGVQGEASWEGSVEVVVVDPGVCYGLPVGAVPAPKSKFQGPLFHPDLASITPLEKVIKYTTTSEFDHNEAHRHLTKKGRSFISDEGTREGRVIVYSLKRDVERVVLTFCFLVGSFW